MLFCKVAMTARTFVRVRLESLDLCDEFSDVGSVLLEQKIDESLRLARTDPGEFGKEG
jgi:hypothetical protein